MWAAAGAAFLIGASLAGLPPLWRGLLWTLFIAAAGVLLIPQLRRMLVSDPLLVWFKRVLPQVSQTEQEALDAGTVWWDGDLFSGRPDWSKLLAVPRPALSAEERAFLDGPVEELCRMVDEWKVTHELQRPAARGLAVHQGQRLPRDDHPQAVRRHGLLRPGAFRSGDEARAAAARLRACR